MKNLKHAIAEFHRAAEEVENLALIAMSDRRNQATVEDSRQMRDRLLDAQVRGARAERYVLEIPVSRQKREASKR